MTPARENCRAPTACAAKGAGHCRACNMRQVIARPSSWAARRETFAARSKDRTPRGPRRMPGPPPAPLSAEVRRWVGWFLAAGWTAHEVAHLFGLGVRRVRREARG